MRKRTKRVLVALAVAVAACAVGARIFYVDSTAVGLPVEHYAMGQWVDLDGAFLENASQEDTRGYSVKVKSARVMSYNDYIRQFGTDKSHAKDGFNTKSVLDLEVELRNNDADDDGSFFLFGADLVPARKNNYLIYDRLLWSESEPNQSPNSPGVRLKKNSEYTTNIPFQMNLGNKGDDKQPQPPLIDTSFELIVSNSPVRKVIDIQV